MPLRCFLSFRFNEADTAVCAQLECFLTLHAVEVGVREGPHRRCLDSPDWSDRVHPGAAATCCWLGRLTCPVNTEQADRADSLHSQLIRWTLGQTVRRYRMFYTI